MNKNNFLIRVLTRDINKISKESFLRNDKIELVVADSNNIDSLNLAFKDAYGVFALTNFWEIFSYEKEK